MGAGPKEADDLFKAGKRRFHQGPRVRTLNFEAGYMHAVFPKPRQQKTWQSRAGAPSKFILVDAQKFALIPTFGPSRPSFAYVRLRATWMVAHSSRDELSRYRSDESRTRAAVRTSSRCPLNVQICDSSSHAVFPDSPPIAGAWYSSSA